MELHQVGHDWAPTHTHKHKAYIQIVENPVYKVEIQHFCAAICRDKRLKNFFFMKWIIVEDCSISLSEGLQM